ncbi:MAG: hypothetical protein ACKO33_00710 [Bacteroidota bacterium]
MEVHHKHHAPRSIKEYLTEFFMLFTAVTLGFFVENIREHYIEDKRGYTYAQRLLDDLQEDSTRMDRVYKSAGEKVQLITSLMPFLADPTKIKQAVDSFYYFGFWAYNQYGNVHNLPRFYRVEETIDELRAGNLRLIKSDSVIYNLAAYARRYNILQQIVNDYFQERSERLASLHKTMFDRTYYLLHEKDNPRTFPLLYRDVSTANIYELKTELLTYRIDMLTVQINITSLQRFNARLTQHLRDYIAKS